MSSKITPDTVAAASSTIGRLNPNRHSAIASVHHALVTKIDGKEWTGTTADNLVASYYELYYRYFDTADINLGRYGVFLKAVADNYNLSEKYNKELAETYGLLSKDQKAKYQI